MIVREVWATSIRAYLPKDRHLWRGASFRLLTHRVFLACSTFCVITNQPVAVSCSPAGHRFGFWRGHSRGNILLFLRLRLQTGEIVGGALRMRGGGKDRPLVTFQGFQP